MPNSTGLFDSFDNLDQIQPEAIAFWLKNAPQLIAIENYLANRILYPQTIALSQTDMQIDLAILREALKLSKSSSASSLKNIKENPLAGDNPFLNVNLRKILIPVKFLKFIPDLKNLVWAFIDALLLNREKKDYFQDLWTIVLTDQIDEIVGSVLLAQFADSNGSIDLGLLGKNYKIQSGGLMFIPCPKDRCEIAYKLRKGFCLGKTENALEVYGGKLGIVIDGRII